MAWGKPTFIELRFGFEVQTHWSVLVRVINPAALSFRRARGRKTKSPTVVMSALDGLAPVAVE